MFDNWDTLGRFGLDVASTATSLGFSAAKESTKLGFSITRVIVSSAAGLAGSVVDHAVFGGHAGAGETLGALASSAINVVEACTLVPISVGESITSTTLVAAYSSLSVLQAVIPGSDEASFSLASFVTLLQREWHDDMQDGTSPKEKYGVGELMKALVAWAVLQRKTSAWQENKWFKHLIEIDLQDKHSGKPHTVKKQRSQVHFRRDHSSSGHGIVTADIGEALPNAPRLDASESVAELKSTLRRFSQLVLAGYGGASLLFFGVPPVPTNSLVGKTQDEEAQLTEAVGSSEDQAAASGSMPSTPMDPSEPGAPPYSWWDVLLGKHDQDILLQYASASPSPGLELPQMSFDRPPIDATLGGDCALMPRFWVLTDHARREVVLVLRGTMSLNELAVDLTCDPADFRLYTAGVGDIDDDLDDIDEEYESLPGSFPIDISTPPMPKRRRRTMSTFSTSSEDDGTYPVHGGMLKMARAMGCRGKPVHVAVKLALQRNDGYSLIVCGHSLGAGVAGMLALMWADPHTCLTHRASGLPPNRHVAAYLYAPPCLVSARLSRLAGLNNLITSFVYSHDVVSRLSLGSVRDLRRAASWLCEAEKEQRGDGYGGVTARALKGKTGFGSDDDEEWFLSIRKTLEANMRMAHLFPPGRVFWAIRDKDLDPIHQLKPPNKAGTDKLRLFQVTNVEQVYNQMIFAKDMLSSHLPHQYDKALHELL